MHFTNDLRFPYLPLGMKALRIQGNLPAARGSQQEMLKYAARHLIKPIVMTFALNLDGIEEAMETLRQGKMRYRGGLVHDQGE